MKKKYLNTFGKDVFFISFQWALHTQKSPHPFRKLCINLCRDSGNYRIPSYVQIMANIILYKSQAHLLIAAYHLYSRNCLFLMHACNFSFNCQFKILQLIHMNFKRNFTIFCKRKRKQKYLKTIHTHSLIPVQLYQLSGRYKNRQRVFVASNLNQKLL